VVVSDLDLLKQIETVEDYQIRRITVCVQNDIVTGLRLAISKKTTATSGLSRLKTIGKPLGNC
jgi:hypothetical protein